MCRLLLLLLGLSAVSCGDLGSAQGNFSHEGQMRCTWRARGSGRMRLSVDCENPEARVLGGVTELSCEYEATPESCPGFRSDPRGFWKQVGRAFKRLRAKVCLDKRALVKAAMCKRASRDAHFRLDLHSSVASAQSGEPQLPPPRSTSKEPLVTPTPDCRRRADHRVTAEGYCSSAWASVCAFFLSVLQRDEC